MIHKALARKYRPTRFSELIAQKHVAAGLTGALVKNRVGHAYLLTGQRGVGKTTAARILAMALNCERRAAETDEAMRGEPCGECDSCRSIWSGTANLDVVEIDAASNRGVDDARELRERAMYAASGPDRHKVYIIDEAHMLTREAWNALLKILEEPPPRVVFVFATTEPQKIANTAAPVLSRLQRFDFRPIGPQAISHRLRQVADAEGIAAEGDALDLIARVAGGGMRDGLSLLDQVVAFGESKITAARVREVLGLISDELYEELLDIIAGRETARVFPFVARLVEGGSDLGEFVNSAGELLRSLLMLKLGGRAEGLTDAMRSSLGRHSGDFNERDLLRMLRLLRDAEESIRRSPNARLHVETLLVHWTLIDRTVDIEELLSTVRGHTRPSPAGSSAGPGDPAVDPKSVHRESESGHAAAPKAGATGSTLSMGELRERWSEIEEVVGRRRRMLREALGGIEPASVDGCEVVIEVGEASVKLEGLQRGRSIIADAIREVTGKEVELVVRPAGGASPVVGKESPGRLTLEQQREERLKAYRTQDRALDAAADALDLELLE